MQLILALRFFAAILKSSAVKLIERYANTCQASDGCILPVRKTTLLAKLYEKPKWFSKVHARVSPQLPECYVLLHVKSVGWDKGSLAYVEYLLYARNEQASAEAKRHNAVLRLYVQYFYRKSH